MSAVERQPVALDGLVPVGAGPGEPGLVAVPSREWLWAAAVPALVRLLQVVPAGSRFLFACLEGTVAGKRNAAVTLLLETPALQWLLFVDADMTPPADALARLLAWRMPVVGATCVRRTPPYDVCAEPPAGSEPLSAAEWVGTGCLLVRRRVLEALPRPWFVASAEGTAEDVAFCGKARAAGFPVYLDRTLRVGHLGVQSLVAP